MGNFVTIEGEIIGLANANEYRDITRYSAVDIGDQQIRNVSVPSLVGSFFNVGSKGKFLFYNAIGVYVLYAIKCEKGERSLNWDLDVAQSRAISKFGQYFLLGSFLIFVGIFGSIGLYWSVWAAVSLALFLVVFVVSSGGTSLFTLYFRQRKSLKLIPKKEDYEAALATF